MITATIKNQVPISGPNSPACSPTSRNVPNATGSTTATGSSLRTVIPPDPADRNCLTDALSGDALPQPIASTTNVIAVINAIRAC